MRMKTISVRYHILLKEINVPVYATNFDGIDQRQLKEEGYLIYLH